MLHGKLGQSIPSLALKPGPHHHIWAGSQNVFPLPGRPDQTRPPLPPDSPASVWNSQVEGFLSFPPQRTSKQPAGLLCVCVFRCQKPSWNTGSFFSFQYRRLYSNLILNHPDGPHATAPLLWHTRVALLMLDFGKTKQGRGKTSVFQSQVNLDSCARRYTFSRNVCVPLQSHKDWPLSTLLAWAFIPPCAPAVKRQMSGTGPLLCSYFRLWSPY